MVEYSALHYASKAEKSAVLARNYAESINPDKFLDKTQITNCITEIPQDIKLELNNGTLTLKAGSKVYKPNGFEGDGVTPKFDVVVVESDVSLSKGVGDEQVMFFTSGDGNSLFRYTKSAIYSGLSKPSVSTQYAAWYDTSVNKIKVTSDTGATWVEQTWGLPLAWGATTASSVVSVVQIFNGLGYIGSTIFALPNVKGLIPNGRNEDGSLRNIEFTTTRVMISTVVATKRDLTPIVISGGALGIGNPYSTPNGYRYLEDDNILFVNNQGKAGSCYCGDFSISGSKIDFFKRSNAFHAIDRSDSSWVSAQGRPSSKYIDLTLGADGATYTMPATGVLSFLGRWSNSDSYLQIANTTSSYIKIQTPNIVATGYWGFPMSVKKGDVIRINYNKAPLDVVLRFTYAEGEVN